MLTFKIQTLSYILILLLFFSGCTDRLTNDSENNLDRHSSMKLIWAKTYDQFNDYHWTPDNSTILLSYYDGEKEQFVEKFNFVTESTVWKTKINDLGPAGALATNSANSVYQSISNSGNIQAYSLETGELKDQLSSNNCNGGQWLFYIPPNNQFITLNGVPGRANLNTVLNSWGSNEQECVVSEKFEGILDSASHNESESLIIINLLRGEENFFIWNYISQEKHCEELSGDFAGFVEEKNYIMVSSGTLVSFFDINTCELQFSIETGSFLRGYMTVSNDGNILAIAGQKIEIWDINSKTMFSELTLPDGLSSYTNRPSLTFSPDGKYLAALFTSQNSTNQKSAKIFLWQAN